MNSSILVTYKSVTGFTKQYAEMIAEELDCGIMDIKSVSGERMSEFDTIVFGGRFHAGSVDGLKKAKELFSGSKATKFIVFATGATPNDAEDVIKEAWEHNFTPAEMESIPHFYMQGGLRYQDMPFGDKLMMKVFAAMLKKKKDKNDFEKSSEKAISSSYDISDKKYINPLVSYLKEECN